MRVSPKPTSMLLVGALFISLFLGPGLADSYSDSLEEQNKLKEISSSLIPPKRNTDLGQLKIDSDTIYYPWASRRDSALTSSLATKGEEIHLDNSTNAGNYLNVVVSGISVSALNTIKGGNAVATSNIVIEPVQIIICDPAVEDKLR